MTRQRTQTENSGIEAVQVQSLAEAAAQTLRDAIVTGKLRPGDRLVEQHLAAQLTIGQPTLREALKELEYQGFVRKVANKGTYVTNLSKEDFHKIHQVRMVLETLAVEQAAPNISPQVVSLLETMVDSMDRSTRKLDRIAFHKADLQFHRTIWRLSGNEYLSTALDRVIFSLFAFVLRAQEQRDFLAAVRQHREIVEGLGTRDPVRARDAFVRTTNRFWEDYHQVKAGAL
jgi:DNA-binding GntR family transcriptional regulator